MENDTEEGLNFVSNYLGPISSDFDMIINDNEVSVNKFEGRDETAKIPESPVKRINLPRRTKSNASRVWQNILKHGGDDTEEEDEPSDKLPKNVIKKGKSSTSAISNKNKINTKLADKNVNENVKKDSSEDPKKQNHSELNNLDSNESGSSSTRNTADMENPQLDLTLAKKDITKKFKCDQCERVYKYKRGLRQHKRLECNVPPQFLCPYCPSRYRYRQGIREHVRVKHELAFPRWYATHYVAPMLKRNRT